MGASVEMDVSGMVGVVEVVDRGLLELGQKLLAVSGGIFEGGVAVRGRERHEFTVKLVAEQNADSDGVVRPRIAVVPPILFALK
eukprot:CAMPEP_0116902686 /NCGR_PEP_ID=MMETSP0467-20121206/10196_1 /TAXON_ID=283647 /ORGANISM="Mesodinium pulex, Strain SPMC105" /LENGTH=83 /DNA_ID=CAMNT_0004576637 /DNA_START=1035 /DNA_END=1286 /DNA_ORIENTATION=+